MILIGGAYFVKARFVGGHKELHRQVMEQLRYWLDVYQDNDNARLFAQANAFETAGAAVSAATALYRRAAGNGTPKRRSSRSPPRVRGPAAAQ